MAKKKQSNTEIHDRKPIPADEYYRDIVHTYIRDQQKGIDNKR